MSKTKLLTTLLLAMVVLFAQVGTAAAAPQAQDITTIKGIIHSITVDVDTDGNPIVLVELADDLGNVTQTIQFTLEEATYLGLVKVDPDTSEVVPNNYLLETDGNFVPDLASIVEEPVDESNHPISVILAAFFGGEASAIDEYHEDGYGFGVIAQALWISRGISDSEDGTVDPEVVSLVLQAKTDKDFDAFFEAHPELLAEGESAPTNWGQFKKLLSEKKDNLGSVVSGKADKDKAEDVATVEQSQPGNGKDKNNDKSNNGKGKDKSKDKGKGKGKDN